MACIKPPVTQSVGKTAIIGVTRPAFASGPTVGPTSSTSAISQPNQRSEARQAPHPNKVTPEVRAATDRAEQAVQSAPRMSLEQIGSAKKDAQRALTAARSESSSSAEISRLEAAVKELQRAEARKRSERAAQERDAGERAHAASRWVADYLGATAGQREVVEVVVDGFTYLYDSTTAPAAHEAANRVVAVRGRSGGEHGPRDTSRMRGHPNPNRVDRGHLVARAVGGGYDLNLIPQDPKLNRGHSEPGKVWRELENHLAKNPGTEFFVRPTYGDTSDYPTQLEFGVQLAGGEWRVETFDNRPPSEDS